MIAANWSTPYLLFRPGRAAQHSGGTLRVEPATTLGFAVRINVLGSDHPEPHPPSKDDAKRKSAGQPPRSAQIIRLCAPQLGSTDIPGAAPTVTADLVLLVPASRPLWQLRLVTACRKGGQSGMTAGGPPGRAVRQSGGSAICGRGRHALLASMAAGTRCRDRAGVPQVIPGEGTPGPAGRSYRL
jgi:hypothetical protein